MRDLRTRVAADVELRPAGELTAWVVTRLRVPLLWILATLRARLQKSFRLSRERSRGKADAGSGFATLGRDARESVIAAH
jgi:hypothetical protein